MLDAFVLPAGLQNSDFNLTAQSLESLPFRVNIRKAQFLQEVIDAKKKNPYYCFFFDVERLDAGLLSGLHMFLALGQFDVLVLWKRNERREQAEFRPRIFRSNVMLKADTMTPLNPLFLQTETVLNGWVLEHGYSYYPY